MRTMLDLLLFWLWLWTSVWMKMAFKMQFQTFLLSLIEWNLVIWTPCQLMCLEIRALSSIEVTWTSILWEMAANKGTTSRTMWRKEIMEQETFWWRCFYELSLEIIWNASSIFEVLSFVPLPPHEAFFSGWCVQQFTKTERGFCGSMIARLRMLMQLLLG